MKPSCRPPLIIGQEASLFKGVGGTLACRVGGLPPAHAMRTAAMVPHGALGSDVVLRGFAHYTVHRIAWAEVSKKLKGKPT
jgi:hypothetical protein